MTAGSKFCLLFGNPQPHIIIMNTLTAVALAGETTRAILDVLVDNINDVNLLRSGFFHASKERSGDVHRVAFSRLGLPFRTSIFIVIFLLSSLRFSADIFIINPCGSHVNPRSVEWIFRCIFLCSNSGDWGRPSASIVCRFPRNLWERYTVLAGLVFILFFGHSF